jgi:NADH-quinone oxidoreductase subunit N
MTAEQLNQGLWAVLPELLLLVLGFIVIGVDLFRRGKDRRSLGWISLIGLLGVLAVVIYQTAPLLAENAPAIEPVFSGMIKIDLMVQLFRLMFVVASILTCLISIDFKPMRQSGEYYALVLFSTLGMSLMAASSNIVMLYLSLETTSIALYMLAGFMRDTRPSTEAGMKYFLFGAFTSTIMLYGLSLLFGFTGQTSFQGISAAIASLDKLPVMVALVLVLVGFGFKVAAVPFHMWTPDVYEGAPTPITAFISVASKAAGFAVLLRFFLLVFGPLQAEWIGLISALAVLTMTLGNVLAISQRNIKRMLAYSSIGQAGYVLIGVAAVGTLGTASIIFYLAAYVLTNIAAFAVVEVVTNVTGSELIKDMAGFSRKSPAVSFGLLAAMLSLAGVPPLAGFFGKFYVFNAAVGYQAADPVTGIVTHPLVWLAIIGVLNSIVALYYYLIILKVVYVDRSENDTTEVQVSGTLKIGLLIASIGMLVMGIVATPWYDLATKAATLLR